MRNQMKSCGTCRRYIDLWDDRPEPCGHGKCRMPPFATVTAAWCCPHWSPKKAPRRDRRQRTLF